MSPEPQLALVTDARRYEALFRISEALSACGDPEKLARVLADQLRELISFDHLDVLVFKENSNEIEWHGWGARTSKSSNSPWTRESAVRGRGALNLAVFGSTT